VDWPSLLGPGAVMPSVRGARPVPHVGVLASVFQELAALDDADAVVRRAVEFSREAILLDRVAIFLADEAAGLMTGTWGTDIRGRTVDEHHVVFAMGDEAKKAFRRAAVEGIPWTLIDDGPIVVQLPGETRVVGRGWTACTPIASGATPIAMMFNDAGLSGRPLDESRQTLAAIFCAFLGTVLDRDFPMHDRQKAAASFPSPVIAAVARSLAEDPSLSGAALARRYALSPTTLARTFKTELGASFVEYRNRLRMARFWSLARSGRAGLLTAALEAGFGSYAQFHRVFRATHGASPREYLRARRSHASPARK
jgi:AraC-like DNA-binding protein